MDAIIDYLPQFLRGFTGTLLLLASAGAASLVLGALVATLRISPLAPLRAVAMAYTEVLRNTPLTLVLFFCATVLPYLGAAPAYTPLAIIGLTAYTSPFVAEAIRSGVNAVPMGQAEAARSIGLTFGGSLRRVVLPQALRMVVPPLLSVLIALTKNTSVAGGFFVFELFNAAKTIANVRGDAVIAILVGVALCYLAVTVPLGRIAAHIEQKVSLSR